MQHFIGVIISDNDSQTVIKNIPVSLLHLLLLMPFHVYDLCSLVDYCSSDCSQQFCLCITVCSYSLFIFEKNMLRFTYFCFMCMYICLHVCIYSQKALDPSMGVRWLRPTMLVLGPLQERHMLLSTEPPLQPQFPFSSFYLYVPEQSQYSIFVSYVF